MGSDTAAHALQSHDCRWATVAILEFKGVLLKIPASEVENPAVFPGNLELPNPMTSPGATPCVKLPAWAINSRR